MTVAGGRVSACHQDLRKIGNTKYVFRFFWPMTRLSEMIPKKADSDFPTNQEPANILGNMDVHSDHVYIF